MEKKETVETSESQIAVHWEEEGYYQASPEFIGQANCTDPSIYERFSLENFPECFREYAELLTWEKYWEKNTGYQRRSLLEMVCWWKAQCKLQLCGQTFGKKRQQNRYSFCS